MKQNSLPSPRHRLSQGAGQSWCLFPLRFRSSAAAWWMLLAVLVGIWYLPRVSTATAQEDAAEAGSLDEQATETGGSEAAADQPPKKTMLWYLNAGGITGYIICIMSVIAVGFIIEHFITIRKNTLMPERVATDLGQLIHQGKVNEAIEYCSNPEEDSLISEVVLAGLQRFQSSEFGFVEYKSAVEEAGEDRTAQLYRKTEVLAVIGAVAPMLGLLGTVQGMIVSFEKIASTSGAAKPYELADGIALALVTTFQGLVVAIPSMVAFSYFRNRIDSIVAEAGKRVEQIMMPLGRRRP